MELSRWCHTGKRDPRVLEMQRWCVPNWRCEATQALWSPERCDKPWMLDLELWEFVFPCWSVLIWLFLAMFLSLPFGNKNVCSVPFYARSKTLTLLCRNSWLRDFGLLKIIVKYLGACKAGAVFYEMGMGESSGLASWSGLCTEVCSERQGRMGKISQSSLEVSKCHALCLN